MHDSAPYRKKPFSQKWLAHDSSPEIGHELAYRWATTFMSKIPFYCDLELTVCLVHVAYRLLR